MAEFGTTDTVMQQNAPQGGTKLREVLSVVAPILGGVMATYGPNYAQGARIGLSGINAWNQMQDKKDLGKSLIGLIDSTSDEELKARQRQRKLFQPKASDYGAPPDSFVGPLPPRGESSRAQYSNSVQKFAESYPEPVRNKIYDGLAQMAQQDPKFVEQFLGNRSAAIEALKHEGDRLMVNEHTARLSDMLYSNNPLRQRMADQADERTDISRAAQESLDEYRKWQRDADKRNYGLKLRDISAKEGLLKMSQDQKAEQKKMEAFKKEMAPYEKELQKLRVQAWTRGPASQTKTLTHS